MIAIAIIVAALILKSSPNSNLETGGYRPTDELNSSPPQETGTA